MGAVLISTSVLILFVILLRAVCHRYISQRLQYALWLLVALKLLLFPVPHLQSAISFFYLQDLLVSSFAKEADADTQSGSEADSDAGDDGYAVQFEDLSRLREQMQSQSGDGQQAEFQSRGGMWAEFQRQDGQRQDGAQGEHTYSVQSAARSGKTSSDRSALSAIQDIVSGRFWSSGSWLSILLGLTGVIGSVILAVIWVMNNHRFRAYLKKNRKPVTGIDPEQQLFHAKLGVYVAEQLPSPCLFGKAIYITPDCLLDEIKLRHVLAHEVSHARQGDGVWSTIRGICLILYWWHPLVWVAAYLSKQDCELSCDAAALRLLGDGQRQDYGKTLLSLITADTAFKDYLSIATTMTAGKSSLKRRISCIAKKPQVVLPVCVIAVAVAVVGLVSTSTVRRTDDGAAANPQSEIRNPVSGFYLMELSENALSNAADRTLLPDSSLSKTEDRKELSENDRSETTERVELSENNKSEEEFTRMWVSDLYLDCEEKTFSLSVDPLSSYWTHGTYLIKDGYLRAVTDDGRYHYTFEVIDEETLKYMAEESSAPIVIDERQYIPPYDDALFKWSAEKTENLEEAEDFREGEEVREDAPIDEDREMYPDDRERTDAEATIDSADYEEMSGAELKELAEAGMWDGSEILDLYVYDLSRSAKTIDIWSFACKDGDEDYYFRYNIAKGNGEIASDSLALDEKCRYYAREMIGSDHRTEITFDAFADYISERHSLIGHYEIIGAAECTCAVQNGCILSVELKNPYPYITNLSGLNVSYDYLKTLDEKESYTLRGRYEANLSHSVGADGLGEKDIIEVYTRNMSDGVRGMVLIDSGHTPEQGVRGNDLFCLNAHTARAGWTNIYLVNLDGQDYIFQLQIDVRGEEGRCAYYLYSFQEQAGPHLAVAIDDAAALELYGEMYQPSYEKWVDMLQLYLQNAQLLLSTQDGELRVGPGNDSERYRIDVLRDYLVSEHTRY